jgi:hypothetical protein
MLPIHAGFYSDVVEWVILLLGVTEVSSSNLGPETSHLKILHALPRSLEENTGVIPQIRPRTLPSTSFSIHCSRMIVSVDAIQPAVLAVS